MRIEIVGDEKTLAVRAADIVCEVLRRRPTAVLGLPTGNTPLGMYAELLQQPRHASDPGRTGQARMFAVDEFLAGPIERPGSNAAYFHQHLNYDMFWMTDIPESGAQKPSIREYADEIRQAGGMDLCVLGVGTNGHIAFNEPGSKKESRARIVKLTDESRRAHAEAFGTLKDVPKRAVTLGVADILESRAILVLAQGEGKAAIIARAIEGPQTADVPASWLQTHRDVTWLLDEAAASQLQRR